MAAEKAEKAVEPPVDAIMMGGFSSALSTQTIEASLRRAESEKVMVFIWHAWANVTTRTAGGKNLNHMRYWELPRLELIPVYAWPIPVIRNGKKGFSMMIGTAGAMMGSSDTTVTQRSQLAGETERYIRKRFGNKGVLPLDCLTCEDDKDKANAFLLHDAVMLGRRPFNDDGDLSTPGSEVRMLDLPVFLAKEGPALIDYAIENGVDVKADPIYRPGVVAGHYPLPASLRDKGLKMLGEMQEHVALAIKVGRTVLLESRGQIENAGKQISDSKARRDDLDDFLSEEIYDFSWNTGVEQALRASQPMAESMERASTVNSETTNALLQELIALRKEVNEIKVSSKKEKAA